MGRELELLRDWQQEAATWKTGWPRDSEKLDDYTRGHVWAFNDEKPSLDPARDADGGSMGSSTRIPTAIRRHANPVYTTATLHDALSDVCAYADASSSSTRSFVAIDRNASTLR